MVERAKPGLHILVLTPQLPYPPRQGTSLRNYNLLRYLAARYRVSLLSFVAPGSRAEDLAHLRSLCHEVQAVPAPARRGVTRFWQLATSALPDMAWRLASPAFEQALADWLEREALDVLQVEGIEMARYLRVLGTGRPLVVFDDHNAEYVLQKRAFQTDARHPGRWAAAAYSLVQWLKLWQFERQVCRQADRLVAVSEADARALVALDRHLQPTVVPNGVDLQAYRPDLPALAGMAHPSLVYTAKMDFRPNVDAVLWFAQQVLPILWKEMPETRFYVVGQSPSPRLDVLREEPRVTITGAVEETQPYIAGADVYVVPLRVGGGTRLKVLEAMAMGRALVSTSLGAEGLEATDGRELVLADEPASFARQVAALLRDEPRRLALGQAARCFVEQSYGWEHIGLRLEATYGPLAT